MQEETAARYRFADLTLDSGQRAVARGDQSLPISRLTFDFLLVLVEASPNVVTYEEILERVWRGRYASPETVSQRLVMLRKALSDDADHPRYIEVIRGHGCRLIPEAEVVGRPWSLLHGRRPFVFASSLVAVFAAALYLSYSGSSLAPLQATFDQRLGELPRGNPEVVELYSRALDFWRVNATRSLRVGNVYPSVHAYLDRVIELEPEFSMAYALKARAYADALVTAFPSEEDLSAVREEQERLLRFNVGKALVIDPETSVAHMAMARLHQVKGDWAAAGEAYDRALRSDSDHLGILHASATFHGSRGEHDEAIRLAQAAVELDGTNAVSVYTLGVAFAFAGKVDLAADAFIGALEINPAYGAAYVWLGHMELSRGNRDAAAAALERAEPIILQRHPPRLLNLAAGYSRLGMDEKTVELLNLLDEPAAHWHFGAVPEAMTQLMRGDRQGALDNLEKAIDTEEPDHGFFLEMIVQQNVFQIDELDEPEFVELRAALGYQE